MSGFFITFEGGDWAGKSTQVKKLQAALQDADYQVVCTREPGGTPLGQRLREEVMHGEHISPQAEALLYAADRAHHADTLIRPALEEGKVVISDRYLDSSVAYQGYGRGLGERWIFDLSTWATQGLLPDLTFLLDGDPEVLRQTRSDGQFDRIESSPLAFHVKLRESFLRAAAEDPYRFVVLNALDPIEDLAAQILRITRRKLAEAGLVF